MLLTFLKRICLMALTGLVFSSCIDTRQATYFNGVKDGTIDTKTPVPESIIRPNDLLSINVTSLNATATEFFNTPNTAGSQAGGGGTPGYLVNSDGSIQFPMLGNIKAAGLTKEQLKDRIRKSIEERQLLKDPIVNIRYLNFRVTVLGEVKNPTVLTIPNEKVSLLEAIGLAGDLTIYGKRENVLIIREEDGQKQIKRINLNSNELLSSPYYYLKSDDVVYVEPNKARVATSRNGQWLPATLSALSLMVVVVDRLIAK